MANCDSNKNVNKTFIIEPLELTAGTPTISACTTVYSNVLESCSGDTSIQLGTGYVTFNSNIDGVNGFTATTIEGSYFSGGTSLLDIFSQTDTFVTGGTFSDVGDSLSLVRNDGANVVITGITNFFTTGGTYNNNTNLITFDRNDQLSAFTVDLSTIDVNDTFSTGGTYNDITDTITITRNDGDSFEISGITDYYTTGATLIDNIIYFNREGALSAYTVNLSSLDTANTFVSGFTRGGNILSIERNDGVNLPLDISDIVFSGGSGNCITDLYVTNIYGCSPVTIHDELRVSGETIFSTNIALLAEPTKDDSLTQIISRDSSDGSLKYRDVASIIGASSANTFVTGMTFNPGNYQVTVVRNDGFSTAPIDLGILSSDMVVTGGTYDINTGVVTFENNSGGTFNVSGFTSGMTDTYTSAASLSGNSISFDRNIGGSNVYSVSLLPLLSGKTNVTLFNTYTGNTETLIDTKVSNTSFNTYTGDTATLIGTKVSNASFNVYTANTETLIGTKVSNASFNVYTANTETLIGTKVSNTSFNTYTGDTATLIGTKLSNASFNVYTANTETSLSEKVNVTSFNTYTGDTATALSTKVEGVNNVGSGSGSIFLNKTGTDFNLRTLSGGTNTTVTTVGNVNVIDVGIPSSSNTFVTGGTYSGTTIILNRNDNNSVSVTGITSSVTNLSIASKTTTTLDIVSSDGTNATVPSVTTSEAGLSSAADKTKLNGIEAGADVTNTTSVTSAGALMDSEITNLAQVKAFDSSDYATSTQGTTADNALPKSGGAMTGAITTNSTFDGRDVATDGTKLDGIESGADVTNTTSVTSAGALMDSEVTNLTQVKAFDSSDYATSAQGTLATNALPKSGGAMTGAITTNSTFDGRDVATDGTKLDGIEAGADITNTTSVTSAGALMDSEVTDLSGIKSVTISTLQVKPSEGAFANGDKTKLDGVEASADVTDTANVTSAGALMDSEVTNLAQVKAFDSSDYATSAQGTTADNALPKSGGAMTGAITTNSTFDGRDVATDGTKLDGIEASADVTDTANVTSSGALMDSEVTDLSGIKSVTISTLQVKPSEGAFANGDKTKLDGVEASADVTDTANVTSAGALMDSEVTNLAQVKAFDTSDYATSAQGTLAAGALPKSGGAMTGAITTNSTFDGRDVATDGTKLDTILKLMRLLTKPMPK